MSDEFSFGGNLLGDLDFLGQDYEGPYKSAFKKPPYIPPMPEYISPGPEPSILDRAQNWFASLIGVDPDEAASKAAIETINRREQMATEQKQFEEDVARKGLLEARIPGANPEVGTPLDAMAGLMMSMPGGMGRGSFESRNLVEGMRGERADFLKGERTKPNPSEPVEDLTAAMELTPQEKLRNRLTGALASREGPGQESALAHTRLDALLNELAPTLGPHAAEKLNAPELEGLGFQYLPGVPGRYGEKGKVQYDPVELARMATSNETFAELMKYTLEHELSHANREGVNEPIAHALPTRNEAVNKVGGIEGELFGAPEAIPSIIAGETRIGLPEGSFAHTREAGEVRAGVEPIENIFVGGRNILEHDPYTQHLLNQLRDTIVETPSIYEGLTGRTPTKAEEVTDLTRSIEKPTDLVFPDQLRRQIDVSKKQLEAAERQGNTAKAEELRTDIADKESLLAAKEAEIANPPEKGEAQLKAEADIKKHEEEIAAFKAKKAAEAGKPKPTAEEIIAKAVKAEQVTEPTPTPRLAPKKTEKVEEAPTSEGVVSAPANILRKILTETKSTKFNIHTLKNELKSKGIELPAEVEAKIPGLIKELKDRGWVQEKIGGTYTLLAAPPKTLKGISGKKPIETTDIVDQMTKTIEAGGGKVTPKPTEVKGKYIEKLSDTALKNLKDKLPEGSQGRIDVENELTRREAIPNQPAKLAAEHPLVKAFREDPNSLEVTAYEGKLSPTEAKFLVEEEPGLLTLPVIKNALGEPFAKAEVGIPNLTEKMKANLTPEELDAIGKLFGTTTTPKKGTKEVPEEVRLAQQAAIKGIAEKETKKAEGKEPTPPEELGEVSEGGGKQKPYEVTLNDGSTHIVRATTPEEAKTKAESVLEEYGSTKTIDKIEEHLGTLERAAKHEIEPVKTGSEAVSEELKETKKSASEEVKETTRLGREEERLRKSQTKEKFEKKSFNIALSNGRTVIVKARNEKIAREIAESRIKKMGSGVTVESVGIKPTALESAITGGARKLEESGFLQNPVVKLLNAVKSIAFGGDVGHLLRQGKQMNADLLFSKHAGKVLEQLPVIFKSAKSQEFFDKYTEKMYSDPLTKRMVDDFGLDMPGMGGHYKEEAFHGAGLAEKAPIIGKYFAKPSERAYTIGLNFLRDAQIHKWADTLKKDGFTPDNAPEKYHAMARAVNIISQRGHFQPAYQKLFSDASALYGAPRAKAARLQNAFELFRGGTSGRVVRQTAAKTLAFNAGLFGLLKATLGATFVTDSESSDYGKIRIKKNITVDPWMGLGVTARTVAKLVHGKTKSPYTGKTYPTTPSDALMGEFLGGVAPGVKLVWEAMSGTDLRGYQVDRIDSLLNVAPLTGRSIAELISSGDIDDAILLSILQAGGEGVDVFNYEQEKAKQKRLKQERGIGSNRPKFNY